MNIFGNHSSPAIKISGDLLVSSFQTAINNLSTAETAKYVAQQTESRTMQAILSSGASNAIYTTPNDLDEKAKEELLHESLNAHLQKAQSEQISAYANSQVIQLEAEAKKNYIGKKVRIVVKDQKFKPLEAMWQDLRTGEVRNGEVNYKAIKGHIEDLSFERNVLVIQPDWISKLLYKDRKYFLAYVINPDTLKPAIGVELL